MKNKYRKITLTMVVSAAATQQVSHELEEAAHLIAVDNLVYEYAIDDRRSKRPQNAAEYEMTDDDGKPPTDRPTSVMTTIH